MPDSINKEYDSNSFCWCGRSLKMTVWGTFFCPEHRSECYSKPIKRAKIGKYSGPSKKFKGGYEND